MPSRQPAIAHHVHTDVMGRRRLGLRAGRTLTLLGGDVEPTIQISEVKLAK